MAQRHGDSSLGDGTRRRASEYTVWENMRARCYRAANKDYKHYGGRGITVCDRWRHSYANFRADMGRKPTPLHTLERKDNDAGYSPENCVWATRSENLKNKRYLGRRRYRRVNANGQASYFMPRRDAQGVYYKLIIPAVLPADWRV